MPKDGDAIKFERPGRLIELRKGDIRIPHEYQRELDQRFVKKIVKDFDWYQFKVLVIAHQNGEYFVVDGQHRLAAVMLDPAIDLVPCILYDFNGPEEAAIVYRLQTNQKRLSGRDMHKAELFIGGDFGHLARLAEDFMARADATGCLMTVRAMFNAKEDAFRHVADTLIEFAEGQRIHKGFLEAIVYLEDDLMRHGHSLTEGGPKEALFQAGLKNLTDAVERELKLRQPEAKSRRASPRERAIVLRDLLGLGSLSPTHDLFGPIKRVPVMYGDEHIADSIIELDAPKPEDPKSEA